MALVRGRFTENSAASRAIQGRGDSDISDRMSSIVFKSVRRDPLKNHVKIA
jgi:hypothetical protein